MSWIIEKIHKVKTGFVVINDKKIVYYDSKDFLDDVLSDLSLSDFISSATNMSNVLIDRIILNDKSAILIIGELHHTIDEYNIMSQMFERVSLKEDNDELISSIIGIVKEKIHSGKEEKNKSLIIQFEYLTNRLLDIKYYISNEAETKILGLLENTFSNILDKHEGVLEEIKTKKPIIVTRGSQDNNHKTSEMKKLNMINRINVIIDLINSCKNTLNNTVEEKSIENNTELVKKIQAIHKLADELQVQLKIIKKEEKQYG